jgi:hypothetical protein
LNILDPVVSAEKRFSEINLSRNGKITLEEANNYLNKKGMKSYSSDTDW